MIYSTNRTASIGDIDVDVNESYFGEGSLYFMQEAAQDELALFEMAIKNDIDEVLIGESSYELEALNESFVEKTVNKIKELMRKFIEWLKGVTRSALAKLNQFIVRDNVKFCKHARKMIAKMRKSDFKATGTILKETDLKIEHAKSAVESMEKANEGASEMKDVDSKIENIERTIDSLLDKLDEEYFQDNAEYRLDEVDRHLNFLEGQSKDAIKKIKKTFDDLEKRAKEAVKKAERLAKDNKDDKKSDELAMKAKAASAFKTNAQKISKKYLTLLKKMIKVARAVVTRAAGAKNEGVEYSPELIEVMIEADSYELDELLEEMNEGKRSDCDDDDDIEDDEE